jgi:hypothetical protein
VKCCNCGGHGMVERWNGDYCIDECNGCNNGQVWEYKKSKAHALSPGGPFVSG